jgi:DNA-binding NarL/FixJ family response regulator
MEVSQTPIRLLLVDDQVLLRTSLSRVFAAEPDFELVGECSTGDEAAEFLSRAAADVALLSFEAFRSEALRADRKAKFLLIAGSADPRDYAHALKLGASGIFLRSESAARLVHATREIAQGEVWIDPRVIQQIASRFPEDGGLQAPTLSEREQKVLEGIVAGHSNRKIGEGLRLSEGSVKAVVQQLFEKHGVRTRSQLVRIACETGIAA